MIQPKTLKIAFTGNIVLTPDYPDDLNPIAGPLYAIAPGARRRRRSTFPENQIDAQFAFLAFPYRHLVVRAVNQRDADYKYPGIRDITTGLCFLEREDVRVVNTPREDSLSFDRTPAQGFPTTGTTNTQLIARWRDFAQEGFATLKPSVLTSEGDYVRVEVPAGLVSSTFVAEPIARSDFDYRIIPDPHVYAQEISIVLTFDDDLPEVSLSTMPFGGTERDHSFLTFKWYDQREIKLLFGNGSLASIENVLKGSFAGRDHEADYDLEFEVMHDIIDCRGDQENRVPVPKLDSREVLRVPCISTMIGPPPAQAAVEPEENVSPPARAIVDVQQLSRAERMQRRTP